MSQVRANSITNAAGTGAPDFPNGLTVTGGNVGIGVTPSAWGTSGTVLKAMQIGTAASFSGGSGFNDAFIASNSYYDGSNWRYINSNPAYYASVGGTAAARWYTAPFGGAGNAISFTQAMTLDASGNLGIGATFPSDYNAAADNLVVGTTSGHNGITIASGSANQGSLFFADGTASGAEEAAGYLIYEHASNYMAFGTNNTERVRIDASGAIGLSGANYGTAGQALTSNGSGSAPSWQNVGVPAGAVAHFAMNTAPTGWLKANGAAVSRTTYATLFAAINTTFGAGDGSTTFNLPDLRGRFTRNWSDGSGIDSGRAFGSTQDDAYQGHWHSVTIPSLSNTQVGRDGGGGSGSGNLRADGAPDAYYPFATFPSSDGTNGTPRTASETRPTNIALLACIKY